MIIGLGLHATKKCPNDNAQLWSVCVSSFMTLPIKRSGVHSRVWVYLPSSKSLSLNTLRIIMSYEGNEKARLHEAKKIGPLRASLLDSNF